MTLPLAYRAWHHDENEMVVFVHEHTHILCNVTIQYSMVLHIDIRSCVLRRIGRGFQRRDIAKVRTLGERSATPVGSMRWSTHRSEKHVTAANSAAAINDPKESILKFANKKGSPKNPKCSLSSAFMYDYGRQWDVKECRPQFPSGLLVAVDSRLIPRQGCAGSCATAG